MLHTTSQVYGSYYKNDPRYSPQSDRKFQTEPRHFRSLSPTKPGTVGVTDILAEANANRSLIYKKELHSSPFINGQKNINFLNRSMIASDALAAPIYDGPQSAQKRDLSRYQPYRSPSKNPDKQMASKIGHENDYPQFSPTRLSPDGKLPWHRDEAPKQAAVKKLEFEPEAGATTKSPQKLKEQHTPVKTQPEKITSPPVEDIRPVVREPETKKPEPVTQQAEDIPYYMKRAVSAPHRDIQPKRNRPAETFKESAPIQQETQKQIQSNLPEIRESHSDRGKEKEPKTKEPKTAEPKLSASVFKLPSSAFRTSSSEIGKYFAKPRVTQAQNQLDASRDYSRPQSPATELKQILPQRVEVREEPEALSADHNIADDKSVDRSQPKTPASVHSCCSSASGESGKNLLCEICVNKRLKNYKDLERAQEREQEIQNERDALRKLEALREIEQEKIRKAREEALAGTSAVKEALDKKFHDYWEQKRNAGKLTSEEQKLLEQQLEEKRQEALELHQRQKDEYKNELLKQIQEKNEEREREKLLNQAPGQNVSLSPGIHYGGRPYSPEQLKQDLLQQIEEKQEMKRREYEQEKARVEEENERNERMNRNLRDVAEKHYLDKKEALRRAIEEGIAEQQAKKEQALLEKMEDRDRILRQEEILRQSGSDFRRSRADFQKSYGDELRKQMEEKQRDKEEERRWEREAFGTTGQIKDPSYFEKLLKQHQEERAKLREEYQQQIAEKKRQREQEKLEDLQWGKTGFETSGTRYNPLLEMKKSLHEDLAEQIRQKQQEKQEEKERDMLEAREHRERLQRTEEELRKRALENHQRQRDEYRKGLEEGLYYKQFEKDALQAEKAQERANIEAQNHLAKSQLLQHLLNKNAHAKEYSEALAKQILGNSAMKAHEKELDRMAYAASLVSPSRILQKLYSCMDCSRKFPKTSMTKKSAIEPPKKVGWQKY